jgi:hypothetical protein
MLNSYLAYSWASSPERLAIASVVTLGFAVLARALRGVNRSGALAGGIAFHEKAGRSQEDSFCFSWDKFFLPPSRHCRHPSIRTL